MRSGVVCLLFLLTCGLMAVSAADQPAGCPARPFSGSTVADPAAITSQQGVLTAELALRNAVSQSGSIDYCYVYQNSIEAPTLRVNPGDQIKLVLANRLHNLQPGTMEHQHQANAADPCAGKMTDSSTNLHFHGLNVPSVCHQDEVVHTLVNAGDPPFHYQFRIPRNEPPGLYWYHPHPHGMTQAQVMGGASGAIIIEGIEKLKPQVVGLKERVLIVRDKLLNTIGDPDASNLTLNFVPATFPETGPPILEMQNLEKQFWRVLNASGETFLTLQFQIDGVPEDLEVLSYDGAPLKTDVQTKTILVPPAGRVEFIVQGPPAGTSATFLTRGVDTGVDGDPNPPVLLAKIRQGAGAPPAKAAPSNLPVSGTRFADLRSQPAAAQRKLYFSEDITDPDHPKFFITVDGDAPKLFDPSDPPAIVTHQGAVEDWTIENRSGEIHAFHIHQIHFLVLGRNGKPVADKNIRDTVQIPAWDKKASQYPSVKLHMDFRYPESVGTFVYHCHILDHEDGGMMAKIQVLPAK